MVWDAALVLLNYFCIGLVNNCANLHLLHCRSTGSLQLICFADPSLVKGKRTIELGAGTGAVGLAAAFLGADVILSGRRRDVGVTRL